MALRGTLALHNERSCGASLGLCVADNVENLRPVRGGRRAKTLNAVARPSRHVTSGEAEAKFRADWEAAHATDDPLGALWQYVVWFDEQFPAGRASLLYPMLYKCCVTYGCDARYQHDERLLKFWSLLAESFPGMCARRFVRRLKRCALYRTRPRCIRVCLHAGIA